MLAINAEPRHEEYELRKRLGRHTVHSQESGLVRRRKNEMEGDESQPKVEGIVYLVAEWISLAEMKALQSACMLVSIKAREKGT